MPSVIIVTSNFFSYGYGMNAVFCDHLEGISFFRYKFSQSTTLLDFASIKLHDFEPNLYFAGIKFREERKEKKTFESRKNGYISLLNA